MQEKYITVAGQKVRMVYNELSKCWYAPSVTALSQVVTEEKPAEPEPDKRGPRRAPLRRVGRAKLIRKNEAGISTKKKYLKIEQATALRSMYQNETVRQVHVQLTDRIPPNSPFMTMQDAEKATYIEIATRYDGKRVFIGHVACGK